MTKVQMYFKLGEDIKVLTERKKELLTQIINGMENPCDKAKVCDGVVYHCEETETPKNWKAIKELIIKNGLDIKDYFTYGIKEYLRKQKTDKQEEK